MEREELKEVLRDYITENSLTRLNGLIAEICHDVAKDSEESEWWLQQARQYNKLND